MQTENETRNIEKIGKFLLGRIIYRSFSMGKPRGSGGSVWWNDWFLIKDET